MVVAVNGISLVALDLKSQYTGQNVKHAKLQFETDCNPSEIVFQFNKRFLVYFAVAHFEVYMTTKLEKSKTYFLPFNQESNGAEEVGGKGIHIIKMDTQQHIYGNKSCIVINL